MEQRTIVAISTAVGNAAIGVVRLSGDSAHAIAAKMFKSHNPAKPSGYEARFGVLYDNIGPIDEVIALYFYAPNSYTGENVVEFSCHGNPTLLRRVVDTAISLGAVPATAGEFSRRAFANGKLSAAKAEAVGALIAGEGRRSAAVASNALCGLLGRRLDELAQELRRITAAVIAACDYPEDTDFETQTLCDDISPLRDELMRLAKNTELVQSMDSGIETVIVGRPNVGKSTVLNLLCGFDRAIVSSVAGTTRDIVEQRVELCDYRLIIRDTAGIHSTENEIEQEGIRRSKATLAEAQLVIAVFDATRPFDDELFELIQGKNCVAVLNKIDLVERCESLDKYHDFASVATVSAINPDHRERLIEAVVKALPQIPQEDALLATTRQAMAAKRAAEFLDLALCDLEHGVIDVCSLNLEEAHRAVCDMLLTDPTEEVIGAIFSNFCIGK